jgi:ABC-type arginine transport system permease subunit
MRRVDINGLVAGIVVLGVVQGAYSTEVLRGAILAVPQGQIEAARAYGMPPLLMLRRITLPAMLPFAIPGLANLWLIATKDTALLAVVGFNELTQATRQAAGATKAYFTFFIAAGVLYLALSLFLRTSSSSASSAGRGAACRIGGEPDDRARRVDKSASACNWLQPHRIVLIAIAPGSSSARRCSCAGTGCRNMGPRPAGPLAHALAARRHRVLGFLWRSRSGWRRHRAVVAGLAGPAFCTVIRGTPLLLQLWLLYYGLGSLFPQFRGSANPRSGHTSARPGPMRCWR